MSLYPENIGSTNDQGSGMLKSAEIVAAQNGFIIKQNGYFTIAKTIDDVYDWLRINFKKEEVLNDQKVL